MIITLYGPDSYRRIKKLNDIISTYRSKYSGLSHERFDLGAEETIPKLKDFTGGRSIFDPVRLAILDNVLECPAKEDIKEILKAHIKTKDLIMVINLDKKPPTTLSFLLKEPAQKQEFPPLKDRKLEEFIERVAREKNIELDAHTLRYLKETFSGDTWSIATEIEQMSLITNHVAENRPKLNYFLLMNTLKYGRTVKHRLVALELLLSERRDDPARIFNGVAYRLGSHIEAKKFANYDIDIKSGKLEYEEVLLELALRI